MNKLIIFLSFLFISCGTTQITKSPIYPVGTYSHEVNITIKDTKQFIALRGMLRIGENKIILIGLSPFNSTLFTITENRIENDVELTVYDDELKKSARHFKRIYGLIGEAIKADRSNITTYNKLKNHRLSLNTTISFHNQFKMITIDHSKFSIQIKVTRK